MTPLMLRVITALVLLIVVGVGLIKGGWFFVSLGSLLTIVCVYEWLTMAYGRLPLLILGIAYILTGFWATWDVYQHDLIQPLLFLWLLLIVWTTDIGAYFIGSYFQGPLLAPKISPKKTWSGFFGGAICAIFAGWIYAYCLDLAVLYSPKVYLWPVFLTFIAQIGDLLESQTKRICGVKDSGKIFPGHGGALDRLDSILPVMMATALMVRYLS